jgi:hypothetical protein
MADHDWALADAPMCRLPADKRVRLAQHVAEARQYSRTDGVVVVMPADHFIVWGAWRQEANGQFIGEGLPAYIPRKTWERTYTNERSARTGLIFADKTNCIRAAVYAGPSAARILVNENDPRNPASWSSFNPGDHVVVAVDNLGNPMTYVATDGVVRQDQYPIHGKNCHSRPQPGLSAPRSPARSPQNVHDVVRHVSTMS